MIVQIICIVLLIIVLVWAIVKILSNILNKIAQTQFFSFNCCLYEGKLLICSYIDENLPPQEIFDTSQLDEEGLMAIICVNVEMEEPVVYEHAIVAYDDNEGICGVVIL